MILTGNYIRREIVLIMDISCKRSELIKGIQTVLRAIPSKTSMSILECILLTADENGIKLTANDMELGIETYIDGVVSVAGEIALEAKIFSEIIRSLPDSVVFINSDDDYITHIMCEKSKFNIIGRSSEEFSYLPELDKQNPLVISQYSLKEIINQTIFSISDNEANKLMTGELFEIKNNIFKVVSLDGHRISVRKIELKNEYEDINVIIPGKTLKELSKIISGNADEDVNIYFTDNNVIFEFDDTVVVSRIIEGEYFNIDQMFSSDYETKLDIKKQDLLDSISRATLLVKEGDKKPIIFTITDYSVQLRINSAIGSMNEEIDIQKSGKDIMIGFNPKFLIDVLRVLEDEIITIYMVNPKAPCIIKNDDESYLYLVLPVNFNNVG